MPHADEVVLSWFLRGATGASVEEWELQAEEVDSFGETMNHKMLQEHPSGGYKTRVFHRKPHGTMSARYLVKCGCCEERVEIYYDNEELEINGVLASIDEWRSILLPLLGKA